MNSDIISKTMHVKVHGNISFASDAMDIIEERTGRKMYQCEYSKSIACTVKPPCSGCDAVKT